MVTVDMQRATWQAATDHAADCGTCRPPSAERAWAGCPAGRALGASLGRLWRDGINALSGTS